MALASFSDANEWLDGTKVKFVDEDDAEPEANNAQNVVLASLSPVYPTIYTDWDSPEDTPALVREIASLLMASYRYAKKYSENTTKQSSYAKQLEDRALSLLMGLVMGTSTLFDVDPLPVGDLLLSSADYWPNDSTGVLEPLDDIKFRWRDEW